MYIEYPIESSYYCNNKGVRDCDNYFYPEIGRTFYEYVIDTKPNTIIEFGVLHGFSTVCMAQALQDIGAGKIYAYDVWEQEAYDHGQRILNTQTILEKYKLDKFVELRTGDIFNWLETCKSCNADLIHVDINNDGDKMLRVIDKLKSINYSGDILFEGGIVDRDNCWWMEEFSKTPMNSIKSKISYQVLNKNYPGISLIDNREKYER